MTAAEASAATMTSAHTAAPPRGVALVTGASSGIGAATATALARRGYRVIVHGRDEKATAAVAVAVDGVPVCADLALEGETERLADRALEVGRGRVEVLVNNAGFGWYGDFDGIPAGTAERLLAVNLAAPIALTRALLPGMRERGAGRLVFLSSIAGQVGVAGEAAYAATKAGLHCFADSLRSELRGTGVGVGVVVAGVIATPFFERRGTPYARRWPKPMPTEVAADAVVRCVERGAAAVYVPRWLRVPVAVQGVAPGVYRWLDGRFGRE
ncbi:SDR family NAD(P)-dependent oxidoreductase [Catenulispora pinisilvae]|uniref:SDR family NAD(P)-dependent oxidoreductase n=1 Tax=Catenulispora pinisilvae TaxID=2705253 RepID=UPI001E3D8EA2|nr:SDR family NAD(P)-dependent oxidoreductase [Catenulispora pinisilvae]